MEFILYITVVYVNKENGKAALNYSFGLSIWVVSHIDVGVL